MGNCPNRFRSRLAAFRVHAWDRFYIYNIASNDLSRYIPREINGFHITTVRYADDTQLAITGPRNRLAEMELLFRAGAKHFVYAVLAEWNASQCVENRDVNVR